MTDIPDEIMAKAREMLEANMVMGDVDDDTAVFTVAGLLGDIVALLSERTASEAALKDAREKLRKALADFDEYDPFCSEAKATLQMMAVIHAARPFAKTGGA